MFNYLYIFLSNHMSSSTVCCLTLLFTYVCIFFFFFFKQKTAYEVRISDWSSDVCSSDLLVEGVVLEFDGRKKYERDRDDEVDAATEPGQEIGRASCRERVCQYV